ncbi:hypothetical protein ACETRX_16685 [Labrys portucalensis]|jgi:hypothetical protein|uniref:Uncharacterized protein n=1 Tax=Labrys neptuniae TaxID=376174 RepID=A0ABV6ZGF4_9HYPH|nr:MULTISPECIES: hypothetical protein [Labrys]MDT3382576.1 hypothetical protein [Labrys neptuniae]MDZ5452571.1 hypothetical protein [Labrys sp. ZIDIC5]OCC02902.1 hypothetical protein BA190_20920 [Labrys sp. WJW]
MMAHHLWFIGPALIILLLIILFRPLAYQRPPKDSWVARLPADQARKLHWRSIAIAAALIAFVLLVYAVSFVKGPGVLDKGF